MELHARTDASLLEWDPNSVGIAGDLWLYFPSLPDEPAVRLLRWSHRLHAPIEMDADIGELIGVIVCAFQACTLRLNCIIRGYTYRIAWYTLGQSSDSHRSPRVAIKEFPMSGLVAMGVSSPSECSTRISMVFALETKDGLATP